MKEIILKCQSLNKSFGKKHILKDVSLEVNSGDILAFIGPNGAGKTTTIKLILGLQSIDSGSVLINGFDIEHDFVKAIGNVGAIVENPDLYMYLSGYDNLKLVADMYNISKSRIDEVVKVTGLSERINDKVKKYSLGMRQRLGIAQAIIHNPKLLVLDEPTNGLDPEGIRELRSLLKKLAKEKNMAILISSHNLAELESFCNTVCIIQNGTIVETASVKTLKNETKEDNYIIEVGDINKSLKMIPDSVKIDDDTFKVKADKKEVAGIIKILVQNEINVYQVKEEDTSLESAFLKKVGGNVID